MGEQSPIYIMKVYFISGIKYNIAKLGGLGIWMNSRCTSMITKLYFVVVLVLLYVGMEERKWI